MNRILHVQIEQFGGLNSQKYGILTPITLEKYEKTQNFRYQNFKAKFDPVPTPTPHIFSVSKRVFYPLSFELSVDRHSRCLFLLQPFKRRWSKCQFSKKIVKYDSPLLFFQFMSVILEKNWNF